MKKYCLDTHIYIDSAHSNNGQHSNNYRKRNQNWSFYVEIEVKINTSIINLFKIPFIRILESYILLYYEAHITDFQLLSVFLMGLYFIYLFIYLFFYVPVCIPAKVAKNSTVYNEYLSVRILSADSHKF